jgi:hypothetical protein
MSTTSAERSRDGFRASFPARLLRRLGAALRRQRGGDDRLVRVHVGDGRDADARRLDDVDGVDATPGQTWPGAAASFLCMWVVMMVAMMLPSLVAMLAEAEGTVPASVSENALRGRLVELNKFGEQVHADPLRRSRARRPVPQGTAENTPFALLDL